MGGRQQTHSALAGNLLSGKCTFPASSPGGSALRHLIDRARTYHVGQIDEEEFGCQPVPFTHETAIAVELSTVIPHQVSLVGAGQKCARLESPALVELFRRELSSRKVQRNRKNNSDIPLK